MYAANIIPHSGFFADFLLARLAHLTRHAPACSFSRLEGFRPPFLVLDGLPLAIESQDLHKLRYLGMVPRCLHPVTPGNLLLFHQVWFLHLIIIVVRDARRAAVLIDGLAAELALCLALVFRIVHLKSPVKLLYWTSIRTPQIDRLEEEFPSNLPLVATLDGESAFNLLHTLHNAVQRALEQALIHVRWALPQSQSLDHAQLLV